MGYFASSLAFCLRKEYAPSLLEDIRLLIFMKYNYRLFLFWLSALGLGCPLLQAGASDFQDRLFNDMMIVDYWNKRISERLPVTYNHLLQGGYFNMPSARMGSEGEVGAGFSWVPPYHNYNLRCQFTDRLEVSGNYRVFRGVDDPVLTPLGFGDLSDKGANFKLSLFQAEDSDYTLPGIAIGFEDFMGTRSFKAQYAVITQVLLDYHLEASLGYGGGRIHGFFGGVSLMPFRRCQSALLKGISIAAEYDAIPYHDPELEKHPKGREKKSPINFGVKYRLWDMFDFSASYVRGKAWAFSTSVYYNLGTTKGFLPKIDKPLPYQSPVNIEPLGWRRPEDAMVQDLLYAMRVQGFDLLEASLFYTECAEKSLRLKVYNTFYRSESEVRERIVNLLACLVPNDIDRVIVVIEDEGFPIQEYRFHMEYLRAYAEQTIGPHELCILSPLCEVSFPGPCTEQLLFKHRRDLWNFEVLPKTHTFFGSSRGKFKYALGVNAGLNGYIFDDLFYSIRLGYIAFSDLEHLRGVDRLNPSQLPNVRTDIVRYYNQPGVTVDEGYLQKNWNLGKGWYTRAALGYFEEEYAGLASEILYYPLHHNWAIGIEGAAFKKRNYKGLGFTDKVRQYHGFIPFHRKFNFSQYFLDLYYTWPEAQLDFKAMIGKFLADDYGVRYEIARYFPSGLKISIWYTVTNGHDRINGSNYYDKGIAFSLPMDIFYTYSDRSRWSYGMSAWLRDVGVTAETGMKLYDLIREQRNY